MYKEDDYLMLSGIQHIVFCERQWCLIHIEQQWEDNELTAEGLLIHEKVDDPFLKEKRGNIIISRATPVSSKKLGLSGILDIVEYRKNSDFGIEIENRPGLWYPNIVEYKRGKKKAGLCDKIQLVAQIVAFEEEKQIKMYSGSIFYNETKDREQVVVTDKLREETYKYAKRMHELFEQGGTSAAENYKNCKRCSLYDVCMPRLTKKKRSVENYIKDSIKKSMLEVV